jgi:hypothetical protein
MVCDKLTNRVSVKDLRLAIDYRRNPVSGILDLLVSQQQRLAVNVHQRKRRHRVLR